MPSRDHWDHLPIAEYAFAGPQRDRLVAAILDGSKTATSSLAAEYGTREPLPRVGARELVIDSAGERVAITEATSVAVVRLGEVTLEHARAEGEGFADVAAWRAGHERFWNSAPMRAELPAGFELTDDTLVVCVSFRVVRRL